MLLMIKINLLPAEMRRPDRVPLPRRMTIYAGTVLFLAGIALLGTILQWISAVNREIEAKTAQKATLQEETKDYDAVKKEHDAYQARKKAVEDLKAKRKYRWSRRLDILADVIDALPRMWINGLKFGDGAPSGVNQALLGGRTVECFMEMKDSRTATNDKDLYLEVERVITKRFIRSGEFHVLVPPAAFDQENQDKYLGSTPSSSTCNS